MKLDPKIILGLIFLFTNCDDSGKSSSVSNQCVQEAELSKINLGPMVFSYDSINIQCLDIFYTWSPKFINKNLSLEDASDDFNLLQQRTIQLEILDVSKVTLETIYTLPHENILIDCIFYGPYSSSESFKKLQGNIRFIELNNLESRFEIRLTGELNEITEFKNDIILNEEIEVFNEKELPIGNYIDAQNEFIGLRDLNKMSDSIKPFLSSINEFMTLRKMNYNRYWINTTSIIEDSTQMYIPIHHYDGFVFEKELQEKNIRANKDKKEEEPLTITDFVGNASGKDGYLEIDKKTKRVIGFGVWQ